MFIYNIKLNSSKLYKIIFVIIIISVVILCAIVTNKVFRASFKTNDDIKENNYIEITNENYSTILKTVHENIDTYVGKKIKFSGFVYRVYDLDKEQFVLARNMIISSDLQTVIVGFLCNCKDAINFKDYSWVEIEGEIIKSDYHGEIPVIKINSIKHVQKPDNEYVYPPDDTYIPTSILM